MAATSPGMLLDAIRVAACNPTLEWHSAPEPLAGGFWAELWSARLDIDPTQQLSNKVSLTGDLVARIMPDPETAARETIVQKFLADECLLVALTANGMPSKVPHFQRVMRRRTTFRI